MEYSDVPTYTLQNFIELNNLNISNNNIFAYEIGPINKDNIKLNYPYQLICFGLLLVKSGKVLITVDANNIEVSENQILHIYPNNITEFKNLSSDFSAAGVLVMPDYFSELTIQLKSENAISLLSNHFSKVLDLDSKAFESIDYILRQLREINESSTIFNYKDEVLKHFFSIIIYELANSRQLNNTRENDKRFRKEEIAIKFISLVASNFHKNKNVNSYADQLCITRTYLTRIIKEVFNKTPKQIIEDKIVTEAKILLAKNNYNISQITEQFNIPDQASFTKFFKKKTGLTPNAYRKKVIKD